jgi:hypothetical protein
MRFIFRAFLPLDRAVSRREAILWKAAAFVHSACAAGARVVGHQKYPFHITLILSLSSVIMARSQSFTRKEPTDRTRDQ